MRYWDRHDINSEGHLVIGGCDSVELAKKYGTPLYVMDEAAIRNVCRHYYKAIGERKMNALVCYAGKAFLNTAMCRIAQSEGLGLDVVSAGELYTAMSAGFPMDRVFYHGNAKTLGELKMAVDAGVHAIVIDNFWEIDAIAGLCRELGKNAGVYVRLKPSISAHTHEYIQTARDDAKFGLGIKDGDAMTAVKRIIAKKELKLLGIHCHIGSQIFELEPFKLAVGVFMDFLSDVKKETGRSLPEVNFGGGYGIHYLADDDPLKPWQYVEAMLDELKRCCEDKRMEPPRFIIEPGRSIVGEAGFTLYTVSSVKEIKGLVNYVNCDGSLADNPRPALYQAEYTCALANRMTDECGYIATIAGRSCESSDLLIKNADIPKPRPGDVLAVFSTGAYNYSMASNYNRLGIPAVVLACAGRSAIMVRRQELDDIISHDEIPPWL